MLQDPDSRRRAHAIWQVRAFAGYSHMLVHFANRSYVYHCSMDAQATIVHFDTGRNSKLKFVLC